MSQELVLATSIRGVFAAVAEIVKTYHCSRVYRRAEMDALRDRLTEARACVAARQRGHLIRVNIEEIVETQQLIDSSNLSGAALGCAIDELRVLSVSLRRNFEEFYRG